jgi:ion channel-forming bestrophin family protein
MFIGCAYRLKDIIYWTRREIYLVVLISAIPTALYQWLDMRWLAIPWVPIAIIGTAAAFAVGFKNTQTYNRLWEARQIWGSIVNTSRTIGIMTMDYINIDKAVHQKIIYRHFAWLTALRFQLREPKQWEYSDRIYNKEFRRFYSVPEWQSNLGNELEKYLSPEELQYILTKKNRATQLISLQSKHLSELHQKGRIASLNHIELENALSQLYDHQGRCERIKNFPYPKQFASINFYFVWLLVIMLPLGMLNEFQKLGSIYVWLTIPFSVIVSWMYITMDKVGEASENPFEGSSNDIPMASLCRTIEIDLRDMLDEKDLPAPVAATNNIMM